MGKTVLDDISTKQGKARQSKMLCFCFHWVCLEVFNCYPSVQLHIIIIIKLAAVNPELIPYGQMKGLRGCMHDKDI